MKRDVTQGCQTNIKCYKCARYYIAVRNVSIFPTYFPYFRLFRTHTINLVQTERVLLALTLKDIRAPSLGQVRIACILSSTEESFRYNI